MKNGNVDPDITFLEKQGGGRGRYHHVSGDVPSCVVKGQSWQARNICVFSAGPCALTSLRALHGPCGAFSERTVQIKITTAQ